MYKILTLLVKVQIICYDLSLGQDDPVSALGSGLHLILDSGLDPARYSTSRIIILQDSNREIDINRNTNVTLCHRNMTLQHKNHGLTNLT